jgi:hypothetical protein
MPCSIFAPKGTARCEGRRSLTCRSSMSATANSADAGKTFPFRGKGVAAMPSLEQVLVRFPDGQFLVDVKDMRTVRYSWGS